MKKIFVFSVLLLALGILGYAAEAPKVYLQEILQAAPKPTDKNKARVVLMENGAFKSFGLMSTATGPQGPAGPAGAQGAPGTAGPTGPQGEQGNPGLSLNWRGSWVGQPTGYVTNDAVERNGSSYRALNYSSGSDPELDVASAHWYLVALKGDQGIAGPAGIQGPAGVQGSQGIQGVAGPAGAQGVAGPTGATGATGSTGAQGVAGPKGDKGDQGIQGVAGIGWDAAKLLAFTNISGLAADALPRGEAASTYATSSGLAAHVGDTANPHVVTKTQVGLSNVDNTSDLSKPVSTAVQNALDLKAASSHNQSAETITSGTLDGDRLPAPGAKKGGVTSAEMAAKRDTSAQASTDAAQDLAFANHTSSLGTAAYLSTGTTAGTVAAGDDSRIVGALQPGAPATSIANTPAGSIAATDVDAALRELDAEKATVAQGAKADSALQGNSLFLMCEKPPYNADNTGATFTTAALQSCVSAAMTSGGVAWISGTYKTDANIWINTGSGVIDGTGTIDARASSGDGILLLGSNTNTAPKGTAIKNITVRGAATGKHNINIYGAPYTYLPENITVENVKTLDTVETGIFANGVKGFKALYNYNDGGRRAISVMSPLTNHDLLDDVLLLGNKTKNTTWFGYQTYYGKNVQLLANECDGSLLSGGDNSCITTDRTNNVTAALNILKNSPVRAVLIQGGDNVSFIGNPISNSPEGIKVTGNGEYVEDVDAKEIHGLTIANNPMTNVGDVVIGNGVIGGNISGNTCYSTDPLKCGMSFEAYTRGDSYVMPLTSVDVTGNKITGAIKNASASSVTASNNGSATYSNTGSGEIVVSDGSIPVASATVLGGVKVGANLTITDGVLDATAGGGSVTSVTSANADIAVETTTTTPVLTLNSGTGANQIVKLTSESKLPAVDGSLLTGIVAAKMNNANSGYFDASSYIRARDVIEVGNKFLLFNAYYNGGWKYRSATSNHAAGFSLDSYAAGKLAIIGAAKGTADAAVSWGKITEWDMATLDATFFGKIIGSSSLSVAGDILESVQATVTDTNLTATAAYSKLTVTSTTQRTVTLPAVADIGMTTKLIEVCGTGVVPNVAWAAGAGSVTWGDTGAPTFTSGKCQYVTAVTTNTAATSTAAWRLMTDGRTW